MIEYITLLAGETLPPFPSEGRLYEYILAANGVFIRSQRTGLSVLGCINLFRQPLKGLEVLKQKIIVPKIKWKRMNEIIKVAVDALPNEALFYGKLNGENWWLQYPQQIATPGSVDPENPQDGADALLEMHSHGNLEAFFSSTDNKDERNGFRLYVVMGKVSRESCEFKCRVGVFGHFVPIHWTDLIEPPTLPGTKIPIMGTVEA